MEEKNINYLHEVNNLNLILRFLLETVAFISPAFYIASITSSYLSIILPILTTLTLAAIWGIFAVPNDPSRSGKTVVKTPGWIRLILEQCIFTFGAYCIWQLGYETTAWVFLGVVVVHNLMFWERNAWLVRQ